VLTGDWQALYDEVKAFREACGDAHLKAILATGELATLTNVARASWVAMQAGADFIKTSTGKEGTNATLPFSLVMVRQIREYERATGFKVGYKPAGGIRTAKQSLDYLLLMKEELGDRWLSRTSSAFGASSLLTDIERQLEHFVTGRYAAAHRHADALMPMPVAEIFKTMDYGPAPESDAEARAWLAKHGGKFGHFINGAWTKPGTTFDVIDPSTTDVLAKVTQGTTKDVDAAVAAARKAHRKLEQAQRAPARQAPLRAGADGAEALAPLRRGGVAGQRQVHPRDARPGHPAGGAALLSSRRLGATLPEQEFAGYKSVGVVGQIIPWNFPLLMLAWKIAPALAAGNTVVLKPAEFTPLSALLFAELAHEAGLPPGVINIITGDGTHRRGDRRAQGRGQDRLHRLDRRGARSSASATAGSGKKLSLELGGKSPFIVYEDADLDASSRAWWTPSGSTRGRSAARVRACWCRKAFTTA
jgi:hypothetical protein